MNIKVVRVDINDTELMSIVKQLRIEVFVKGQNVSLEGDWDNKPSENYLVYLDYRPVGTMRWRLTAEGVKIERVSVLEEYRGKGLATLMLGQAIQDITHTTTQPIYLHSQLKAIPLYERLGFKVYGDMFFEEG